MSDATTKGSGAMSWVACAACWGQRCIGRRQGRDTRWFPCPWCLGIGEILVLT
ncbi:MAG: hypothetical protein U0Y82_02725 [Thermoleophilia bacterium]